VHFVWKKNTMLLLPNIFSFKKNFTKQFSGVDHKIQPRYCSPATNYILMPANSSILWAPETLYMAHGQHNQHVVEQGSPE
jgi:hypothetical protein